MKYLSTFLALLSALTVNATMAQEVSVEKAQGRVLDFLKSQTDVAKRVKGADVTPKVSLAYTSKSADKTCFYIFNAGEDEGFVIVGGDEAAREILGYCDHGSFDYDKAPDNFKWWLSQYTEQIAHAAKSAVMGARRAKAETTSRGNIDPLIKTAWDQDAPYNGLIPKYTCENQEYTFITGCVATAMAQVMKYYHFTPIAGATIPSYNSLIRYPDSNDNEMMEIPSITVPSNYSWNNMLNSYTSTTYDPQNANDVAVAELMYHAGASVSMKYGTQEVGGSSTSSAKIPGALSTYFGYDKSAHNEYRGCYSDEDWENMVYTELSNGNPVLYSGSTNEGAGHQFICDGYSLKEGFHINWGWSGNYNGYFLLTPTNETPALTPNGTGNGGGAVGSSYDQGQLITLGLKWNEGGTDTPHLVQITNNSLTTPMCMKVGNEQVSNYTYNVSTNSSQCSLSTTLFNISCLANKFDYGVKAVNKESNDVFNFQRNYQDEVLNPGQYYTSLVDLNFNPKLLADGTYQILPVFRVSGTSEWMDVRLNSSATIPEITITRDVSPSSQLIQLTKSPEFNNDNNPYSGDLLLKIYFRINDAENNNVPTVNFYAKIDNEDGTNVDNSSFSFVNIPSNSNLEGKVNLASLSTLLVPNNKYTLTLFSDASYTESLGDNSTINFTYRDILTVEYGVSPAGYGTLILPFDVVLPEGMTLYSCILVDNNDAIQLSQLETNIIQRNTPYIVKANYNSENPKPYSFTGPQAIDETHLFNDGYLYGAVADDVSFQDTDYIMQYNNGTAAFYLYNNDAGENRKATPYRAFLRIENRKMAPPALPNDKVESIEEIRMNHSMPAGIYSLDGKRQSKLRKGLNVIILEDGTSKKLYVK